MRSPARSERIDIRISPSAKQLLQDAAEVQHKTLSEFVLHSAISAAEQALCDRQQLRLSAEQWTALMEALDAPPRRHPRMERLLQEASVFD
ncbi:DUF1778 domain-containing protein [Merismopedia glauca]|uniref:DUF1778 domain-containing protein n=2 Tax=Merismopedia TaxID=53402 RepID=A0A2T1BY49_9CYAN|nr:DUF1778 domain-containing protein [Merismopedia glauca CCAP 1448/3]